MNLFNRIKSAVSVLTGKEEVISSFNPDFMKMLMEFIRPGNVIGSFDNSEAFINNAYKINADVFSIVNKICDDAANIPWKLFEVKKDGDREEIQEHKILDIWHSPNPQMGGLELRKTFFKFHQLTGNGFLNGVGPKNGNNAGQFHELYVMPSQFTEVISGGWRQPIRGYTLKWTQTKTEIPAEQVLHMRMFNPDYQNGNYLKGLSPVQAATMPVISSNSGYNAKANKFQSGGIDGFISRAEGEREMNITETQRQRIAENIKKNYAGYKKLYITDAPAKWNQVGMSVVDLAILDSLNADMRILCNVWGVDSKLFNDPMASTLNNMGEAEKTYFTRKISPLVNELADELNKWWVPSFENGKKLKLLPDFSGVEVLQKDLNKLADTLTKLWMLPPNEALKQMGFDPVDDPRFDEPWVRPGLIPLSELSTDPLTEAEDAVKRQLNDIGLKMYN